ncbi:hypothetical protein [Modicisalibacter luteus]|uniref:Uncharacterized protein n=1 Tax=Modicisalibacter luteus TaxID=453962 RepID=A0ABV7LVR4_9GAMM|nr:hypothetical protein [Halomonas lutea]GHB06358.1 hypothetical protein GCM10007159_30300 [Halomonas lutea]
MGSKIPEAKLVSGKKTTALNYEKKPFGDVFCCSPGCDAQLSFVKRHDRRYAKKTIEIAPCFRLKKNEDHDLSCRYNIGGQLKIIAKDSESEVFSAISNSKYEFRLHILIKALWELKNSNIETKGKGWGGSGEQNKQYSNKGKLSNYLKTLRQVLELRALCEDNQELKKLVTLKLKSKKVTWENFYFDHENLERFVQVHGADDFTMPLAISGRINEIRSPNEKFNFHVVELNSPFIEPDENGIVRKPVPQIVLKNSSLLKHIDIEKEYIFFGQWKARLRERNGRGSSSTRKWIFENIEMYIDHKDHLIEC